METLELIQQIVNPAGLVNSLDIKPDEYMLPLEEVIVNAIQSIEDSPNSKNGKIVIKIKRGNQIELELEGIATTYSPIVGFTVEDNGVGFNNKRLEAFSQPYTTFNVKKGGKGMGRYTVLACFGSMEIESKFEEDGTFKIRKIKSDIINGLQRYPDDVASKGTLNENRTLVTLDNYRADYYQEMVNAKITKDSICEGIIQHCLLYFLNKTAPTIFVQDENESLTQAIILNDIFKSVVTIEREQKDLKVDKIEETFNISYIRNFSGGAHAIHLCANNRQVGKKQPLGAYLPSFKELHDTDNKKYFVSLYITSNFLDGKVHPQRNKFMLPETKDKRKEFDDISLDELFFVVAENARAFYAKDIDSAEKEKNSRIKNYILDPKKPRLRYRHLLSVPNAFDDIPINASEDIIEAKLHEKEFRLEVQRDKAFNKVFKAKKYDKEQFGNIVHEVLTQEAAFSKDKLADLMIKRKSVIKLFEKYLEWRDDKNFMLEQDLHNIVFTMGSQKDEMPSEYHNLWLLDERFTFHTHTSSDVKTKSVKKLTSKGNKEPDLLIYDIPWAYTDNADKINSLVVFEFKRPGRSMKNKNDKNLDFLVQKYFEDLMKTSARNITGKLLNVEKTTPKFGYVVCEIDNDLKQYNKDWNGFKETPFGHLYKTNPELNLHIEVMTYEQMLQFTASRHTAFFKALGIEGL